MSEILIIHASRYGSTAQVAGHIADSLKELGGNVTVRSVREKPETAGYDMVLLGSGIYSHRFLPEMEEFIDSFKKELQNSAVGMFGVAMRTEVIHKNGRSFGGELILDRYGLHPVVKGMLHGRMDFAGLNDKDRGGLERFYISIGLSEAEKNERRKLRDEMSEDECGKFAEKVMNFLQKV